MTRKPRDHSPHARFRASSPSPRNHNHKTSDPMSAKTETENEVDPTTELKSLLRQAEKALSHSAGEGGEKFDELREKLRDALSDSRFSFDSIRTETVRRAKQADKMVRDNPYYAIGIAAGVGAIVGLLVSRSYSSSR